MNEVSLSERSAVTLTSSEVKGVGHKTSKKSRVDISIPKLLTLFVSYFTVILEGKKCCDHEASFSVKVLAGL